jgi:hypothetical protein
MLLAYITSSILIDPEYDGPFKWEDHRYYEWCETLYRYVDDYGFSEQFVLPGETREDELWTVYTTLAYKYENKALCPQFLDAEPFDKKATPISQPYPDLEWSDFDKKTVFGWLLYVISDPDYPGTIITIDPIKADDWCQVLWDNQEILFGQSHDKDIVELHKAVLKKNLVEIPAEKGQEPICNQFVDLHPIPSVTPTQLPFPSRDWWTLEDFIGVGWIYREIILDPDYKGPRSNKSVAESMPMVCHILWVYGWQDEDFILEGFTRKETREILWKEMRWGLGGEFLCPQFDELK